MTKKEVQEMVLKAARALIVFRDDVETMLDDEALGHVEAAISELRRAHQSLETAFTTCPNCECQTAVPGVACPNCDEPVL